MVISAAAVGGEMSGLFGELRREYQATGTLLAAAEATLLEVQRASNNQSCAVEGAEQEQKDTRAQVAIAPSAGGRPVSPASHAWDVGTVEIVRADSGRTWFLLSLVVFAFLFFVFVCVESATAQHILSSI